MITVFPTIMTPIYLAPGTSPAILWWISSLFGSILGFGPQKSLPTNACVKSTDRLFAGDSWGLLKRPSNFDFWFAITTSTQPWFGFHKSRFEGRHGDADIAAMLENSVPPADLTKVTIFSQHLVQFSKEAGVLSTDHGLFPNIQTMLI